MDVAAASAATLVALCTLLALAAAFQAVGKVESMSQVKAGAAEGCSEGEECLLALGTLGEELLLSREDHRASMTSSTCVLTALQTQERRQAGSRFGCVMSI